MLVALAAAVAPFSAYAELACTLARRRRRRRRAVRPPAAAPQRRRLLSAARCCTLIAWRVGAPVLWGDRQNGCCGPLRPRGREWRARRLVARVPPCGATNGGILASFAFRFNELGLFGTKTHCSLPLDARRAPCAAFLWPRVPRCRSFRVRRAGVRAQAFYCWGFVLSQPGQPRQAALPHHSSPTRSLLRGRAQ